jgi:chromosome segregation ATPase
VIDPEVMNQINALSEEIVSLREDLSHLSQKLDGNNANLVQYVEREIASARDTAKRAAQVVAEFAGKIEDFSDEQKHFKGDFEWWSGHLDKIAKATEAVTRKMEEAEARLTADNGAFKDWAATKINQIGRIFRR